jgi:hypothetical protein
VERGVAHAVVVLVPKVKCNTDKVEELVEREGSLHVVLVIGVVLS